MNRDENNEKDVCSSGWKGVHGTTVTLANYNKNAVTVNKCKDSTYPYAFSSPPGGFTVPAKSGSNPGTVQAVLDGTLGTHSYCTTGCPNDKLDTNPKTVIIT